MTIRPASAALLAVLAGSAAFAPISSAPAASATPPANLCERGEVAVFSCAVGRSLASVCLGGERAHYRYGLPGSPALDIASAGDWGNVHLGSVTGQEGGFEHHARFTAGLIHYTVFAGTNGKLADTSGKSYAGIAVSQGKAGENDIATLACQDSAWTAPDWTSRIAAVAPRKYREALQEESDGPFDAWF